MEMTGGLDRPEDMGREGAPFSMSDSVLAGNNSWSPGIDQAIHGNSTLEGQSFAKDINGTFISEEEFRRRLEMFALSGSNFDPLTQSLLIVAFSVLILFGATGNGLVCYVVARNPHMRTPRNIFIINLAISDLTLCLFTQPFNLMKVSMSTWRMKDFMCKLIPMFAGTNVFVSTISITAIALDRFQVIVYPTKDNMKKVGAAIALISIWVISLLMASPLLIFNVVQIQNFHGIKAKFCIENPLLQPEKGAYSIASMIFQYICPIVIVTVAHARICNKLKYRMVNQQPVTNANSPFQKRKSAREAKRKRKTNLLLIMIAVVFASSWMPLNVFNIIADFYSELLVTIDKNGLVFPICHLLVLSSACTNPVLYGWLNENFRREFLAVLRCKCCAKWSVLPCCRCCEYSPNHQGRNSSAVYSKANTNGATTQHLEVDQGSTLVAPSSHCEQPSPSPNLKLSSSVNLNVPQ